MAKKPVFGKAFATAALPVYITRLLNGESAKSYCAEVDIGAAYLSKLRAGRVLPGTAVLSKLGLEPMYRDPKTGRTFGTFAFPVWLRRRRGKMSEFAFAHSLGMSPQHLTNLRTNKVRVPRPDTLEKLGLVLMYRKSKP
jgi:hypothetical protein